MQHIAQSLLALDAGAAIHFGSLSMVPLRASGDEPASRYLTLAEALQAQRARVTELSPGGSVPELAFENLSTDVDVLLLDGEELIGAKQNRVLNLTLLVGPGKRVVIPVSCVEHGRWRHESTEFAAGDREREAYSSAFEAEPGQVGAVFVVHGKTPIVGLELFDSASTFARCLPNLLGSFVLEAIDRPPVGPAQRCAEAARQHAVELVAALAACVPARCAALGEGEDLRYTATGLAGAGLLARGRLVHLSAFRTSPASIS